MLDIRGAARGVALFGTPFNTKMKDPLRDYFFHDTFGPLFSQSPWREIMATRCQTGTTVVIIIQEILARVGTLVKI